MPADSSAPKWEFCGDEQPHERHEWIDGMTRRDCPGASTVESLVASDAEFPDVPVRPGPLSEYVSVIGNDRQRLVLLVINGQEVTLPPFRARGLGRELIATADRIVRGAR